MNQKAALQTQPSRLNDGTPMVGLPARPGTYVLVLRLNQAHTITVGRLGAFTFPAGHYLYVGSACGPGGLRARVGRHMRSARRHWHIDALRRCAPVTEIWWLEGSSRRECAWADALSESAPRHPPHFGASDCRCAGHLCFAAGTDALQAGWTALNEFEGGQLERMTPSRRGRGGERKGE